MKSKSADDVIHSYIKTILPRIGPSQIILTDNGMEFKNDTVREVLSRLNTAVYYGIFSKRKTLD